MPTKGSGESPQAEIAVLTPEDNSAVILYYSCRPWRQVPFLLSTAHFSASQESSASTPCSASAVPYLDTLQW